MRIGGMGPGVLSVLVAAVACDAAPELPRTARVTHDTIDGVEHVISGSRGAWSPAERWTLDTDAAVTIGTLDGAEEYTFGEVAGVMVAEDGGIYVGDTQTLEVRAFSPAGEFLFRFGRNGEGPDEFGNISGLVRAPEGMAVLDGQQARVTVFGLDGTLVRTFRIERPYLIFAHDAGMAFDGAGRFYDRTVLRSQEGPDALGVVIYGPDGEVIDSIVAGASDPDYVMIERGGRPVMGVIRPFTARAGLALGPEGRMHFTEGDAYRVTVLSAEGDTIRVIRREVEPRLVSEAEADSVRGSILERAREVGGEVASELTLPDAKPIIAALEVDDTGHLWIQSQPDPSSRILKWWVHDPDGRFLGTVATPGMEVMHIGADFVAGVVTDELGVDRVMVIPLRR